jgi:hypothetical protein
MPHANYPKLKERYGRAKVKEESGTVIKVQVKVNFKVSFQ